jgi:hypothetical protein
LRAIPGIFAAHSGERVKVIDDGLAWVEGEPINRLRETPENMVPETAGRTVMNLRTDILTLGTTMYRPVTRRVLPSPTPDLPLGEKAYCRSLVPVAALRPTLPVELCELIHCIDYQPDRRPQSAAEVGAPPTGARR